MLKLLNEYVNKDFKSVRTNIDGHFKIKIPNNLCLEKGMILEIKGEPEIYKIGLVDKLNSDYKPHQYYASRGYVENIEAKLLKMLDLTNRSEEEVLEYNDFFGIKGSVKANYKIFGHAVVVEGKLSKNQVVRFGNEVITITDLIKPEEKGGLIVVEGIPLDRLVVDSVYTVYERLGSEVIIHAEYEDYGDALLSIVRSRKEGKITHL